MFKVLHSGKRKKKQWKRMITKVTFVGPSFTRKPPKYERFIRPSGELCLWALFHDLCCDIISTPSINASIEALLLLCRSAHEEGSCHTSRAQVHILLGHLGSKEES